VCHSGDRSRVRDDDPRLVALYNEQEADSLPLTVERFRAQHAAPSAEGAGEQWVAVVNDQVVGAGSFWPAWWTGDAGIDTVEIRVDESRWREGFGTSVW
jgi:Acetyltransferase (GNAT) family